MPSARLIYLTGISIWVNECAGKLYLILLPLNWISLVAMATAFVGLGIRRRDRFAVDLLDRGAPRVFPALQHNIGGHGIRFMPVDHIDHQSFGGVVEYGGHIEIGDVVKNSVAVFFAVDIHIQSGAARVVGIQIKGLIQRILVIAIRRSPHQAGKHRDVRHLDDVGVADKGVQVLGHHERAGQSWRRRVQPATIRQRRYTPAVWSRISPSPSRSAALITSIF